MYVRTKDCDQEDASVHPINSHYLTLPYLRGGLTPSAAEALQ